MRMLSNGSTSDGKPALLLPATVSYTALGKNRGDTYTMESAPLAGDRPIEDVDEVAYFTAQDLRPPTLYEMAIAEHRLRESGASNPQSALFAILVRGGAAMEVVRSDSMQQHGQP